MILDFQYWWKQFNGPRVKAIMKAILAWMKEQWDDKLSYFWNLDIQTANSAHLTLFGIIADFIRVVTTRYDEDYFYFSATPPTQNSNRGFSYRPGTSDPESDNPYDWGGQLSIVNAQTTDETILVPTEWFRAMLTTWSESEGQARSLKLLDDLTYIVNWYDGGMEESRKPVYLFYWYTSETATRSKAVGDIDLELDTSYGWNNPFIAYSIFTALADTMYTPVPRLYPILEGIKESTEVMGMLQFLSQDDLYISQVYQVTPYTLTDSDFPSDYESVTWNTEKDGTGTTIEPGYELTANNGVVYAYPIS